MMTGITPCIDVIYSRKINAETVRKNWSRGEDADVVEWGPFGSE